MTENPLSALEKLQIHGIDPAGVPKHVAIIMDGNGRWAERQGLQRLQGHIRGYQTVHTIIESAADFNIQAVTLYTFSVENWRRPAGEVDGIMELIAEAALQELDKLMTKDVQLRVSGRVAELPERVREALQRDIERTKDNKRLILNLAINYGGRAEIVDAVRALASRVQSGNLLPNEINDEVFASHLYQPGLSDPDLLIRTAGEMRISNFLLWEIAYAELHVTPVLWPDFTEEDLLKALADYQHRVRKFGGVPSLSTTNQ